MIPHTFEVPYNFDETLIEFYEQHRPYIQLLFLPPYADDSLNAKTNLQTTLKGYGYMPQSRAEYEYHLLQLGQHQLPFVVLWQDAQQDLTPELLCYYTGLGAQGFVIAQDAHARLIKTFNPKLLVISSIVQRIGSEITQRDFTDYDYIVLFFPYTRALDKLKQLTHLRQKLVLIPNSYCHVDCQGVHHWFAKDYNNQPFHHLCPAFNDHAGTHSTFIRPEHLQLFDPYVGGYKLQGREWPTPYIMQICKAYFHRTSADAFLPAHLRDKLAVAQQHADWEAYYNIR